MKKIFVLGILILAIFVIGCSQQTEKPGQTQIANPASVYCKEQGGSLDIKTNSDGSQTGYCTLKDGTECEEWSYFRKECPQERKGNQTRAVQPEQLSEQPDLNAFNEYFTEFHLAKLPVGQKLGPPNFPTKTSVYSSADQFCSSWNQKKDIPAGSMATAVYDSNSKQYAAQKAPFPRELRTGNSAGCQDMTFSAGKYEYKVYVNDVLVAVLPFEVR
ncbi:MAG: DUF333 domain-containing protein [Nanoarchaeota archaeon]